jgi:hypothetical protein
VEQEARSFWLYFKLCCPQNNYRRFLTLKQSQHFAQDEAVASREDVREIFPGIQTGCGLL